VGHEGGGWPGTFRDIGQAADYLRRLAADHQLDLSRVIAIGHSAGGHFATWLGVRHKVPKGSDIHTSDALRLSGVVNLDGPADLKATIPLQQPICGVPVINQLMGGSPEEQPDRYRDGSPVELLPAGVPQEIFAGRMFAKLAEPYDVAAKRAGDDVRTTVLADAGHFVFIDPKSAVWPQVLQSVRRMLRMPM
jgi:pimeloyl-ACP methyl ester carboxylesterase